MDIIIKDDMIKESKSWKKPMIIAFILSVLFPLVPIWNNISNTDVILGEIFFILIRLVFPNTSPAKHSLISDFL